MSVDQWLDRVYDDVSYNCLHFVRDVWLSETGEDVRERLESVYAGGSNPKLRGQHLRAFRELVAPISPCLVIMQRRRASPHWGVFLRGKVLHIQHNGPVHVPLSLASVGFDKVRFAR